MYPYRHISSQDSSFRIRSTQGADFRLCADFSGLTQFCCQFFDSCFNTSFDAGSSRCSEYYDDHDYDCCNDDDTVLFQKCFHWIFPPFSVYLNPQANSYVELTSHCHVTISPFLPHINNRKFALFHSCCQALECFHS